MCPALSRAVASKMKDKNEIERHRRGLHGPADQTPVVPKPTAPKGGKEGKGVVDP